MSEDQASPAEERLTDLLGTLRAAAGAAPGPDFAAAVVGTARWQGTVRQPLRVAGAVLGALGEGVRLLVRGR